MPQPQPSAAPGTAPVLANRLLLLNEFGLRIHGREPPEVLAEARRYAGFLFTRGRLDLLPLADHQPVNGLVRGLTTLPGGELGSLCLLGEAGYAALSSPDLHDQDGQYLAALFLEHLRLALSTRPAPPPAAVLGGEAALLQALEEDRRPGEALVLARYPGADTLAELRRLAQLLEDSAGGPVFALGEGVLAVRSTVGHLGRALAAAQRLGPQGVAHALGLERQGGALLALARSRLRLTAPEQGGQLELQGLPTRIEVVLDWPVGHALRAPPEGRPRLVVTANRHPAYLADLLERYEGVLDVPRGQLRVADVLTAAQALERGERVAPAGAGATGLFPRERQVLRLSALGHTPAQVGRALGISDKTVANLLSALQEKLEASSRVGLVLAYLGLEGSADSGL